MRPARWSAAGLLALALLGGCKREGAERYRSARAKYEQLVTSGRPTSDPAYDEVLRELERVPEGAPEHANAQQLKQSIQRARAPKLERPLVTPFAGSSDDPEVAAKRAECEELAKALGSAPPGKYESAKAKLHSCRAQQHEIEELRHSKDHVGH